MARRFVPDAGHVVWVSFSPQAGHEQAGHRPAVVLSPASYNLETGLMICCPMTTQIKNYPFEVLIAGAIPSAILADQDCEVRKAASRRRDMGLSRIRDCSRREMEQLGPRRSGVGPATPMPMDRLR